MVSDAIDESVPDITAPPGWVLGHMIALGGSSLVYRVTAPGGAPAVLKRGRWCDRDMHARFDREAHALQALGPPATPRYLAHGSQDGWPYLVMEEVHGETLAAWMARSQDRGTLGEIVAILVRLLKALERIHAAGFVHRDLKPENAVIGTADTRILDLGLALTCSTAPAGQLAVPPAASIDAIGSIVGTLHYLAPEQLRTGATIDHRADLYSLGVIAFEMITGQPPFVGERKALAYQHQVSRPPPLGESRAVPVELEDIVLACLAKQPEARPQTAAQLIAALTDTTAHIETLKGMGTTATRALGRQDKVVLAWIDGGDPLEVTRAISDVHGMIVRSRAGGILAAFAFAHHDAPLAVALATCRELAGSPGGAGGLAGEIERRRPIAGGGDPDGAAGGAGGVPREINRCRIVIHHASALIRRSAHGKPAFYGTDIEQVARWAPALPFTGLVLTAAAAALAPGLVAPADDVPGFWRDLVRVRSDATEPRRIPPLVGRERTLQEVVAIAGAGGMLIGITGIEGVGKTRLLAAVVERLIAAGHPVIALRGRRRLPGEPARDQAVLEALAGDAIVVVDDADRLSPPVQRALVRDGGLSRVIAGKEPLFEVVAGTPNRLAIELPALSFADAERLLRDLLQPARLIPDVLLERLVIRGAGNPGTLVALARDIRHRGGIRCQTGNDDWYVAADEIDTLSASPSVAWFAVRALEDLPIELVPIVRAAASLGPAFCAGELAAVLAPVDLPARVAMLVRTGVFSERSGWYEFADTSVQDAIYHHELDTRALVHDRALRYWLTQRTAEPTGWLPRVAFHAAGAGAGAVAAAALQLLAADARRRGDAEHARELEIRARDTAANLSPAAIAAAARQLG